jgi:hypothetical protein
MQLLSSLSKSTIERLIEVASLEALHVRRQLYEADAAIS